MYRFNIIQRNEKQNEFLKKKSYGNKILKENDEIILITGGCG